MNQAVRYCTDHKTVHAALQSLRAVSFAKISIVN